MAKPETTSKRTGTGISLVINFLLLILALYPRRPRQWALVLLHLFLTGTFAAVWCKVLNGYDFMRG
jgi:hypothetical protein